MWLLESERMIFRPHEMADFDDFCAMEADAEVRRYVGGAPRTREGAERKFRDVQLRPIDAGLGLMAMIFKADDKYIGYCGLYPNFDGRGGRRKVRRCSVSRWRDRIGGAGWLRRRETCCFD